MATPPPPDTSDIRRRGRQRLIGAIAIVLLAVVFIPMALDPEPRTETKGPALAIPSKDAVAPLPPPTPPVKSIAPSMAPAKPAEETAKVVAVPSATPDPLAATIAAHVTPTPALPQGGGSKTSPSPLGEGRGEGSPKLEGFAIQVGAFKDEEKLRQARDKLTAAKVPHFIERLPTSDLTRLRTGPYPTRPAAEKALVSVKAAGLEGQVVPLP